MRFGHMAVERRGRSVLARHQYTNPMDAVDGGFCAICYHTADPARWQDELQATIDNAAIWGIHEGWLWTSLGVAIADWQCPGIDAYPRIGNSSSYALPYDPALSFQYGAWLARPGFHTEDRADFTKVKAVAIWPGLFQPQVVRTQGPHLCAFLEGFATREPFDERLREMQRETWVSEIDAPGSM